MSLSLDSYLSAPVGRINEWLQLNLNLSKKGRKKDGRDKGTYKSDYNHHMPNGKVATNFDPLDFLNIWRLK